LEQPKKPEESAPVIPLGPGAPSAIRIESTRLLLRPLRVEDAADIQRLAAEWEVARYTSNIPHPYEPGMAETWIRSHRDDFQIVFAIERRQDGVFVGCIGVEPDMKTREAEFGYWIGMPYWGAGYATEALSTLVDHVFATSDVDRARAAAMPDNRASIRVQEKVGFRYVGVKFQAAPARGGPIGVQVRALDRQHWEQLKAPPPLPIVLVAAVALVDPDGRVLIAQRPEGKSMAGLWEFPGGKVHEAETPETALIRELKEELGIDVKEACLAPLTFASHRYDTFHLLMPLYVCRRWDGTVAPQEGQAVKWVKPAQLADYPMPPADKPLVAMMRDFL
jgi:8-oxo-dGTP diphosphatase